MERFDEPLDVLAPARADVDRGVLDDHARREAVLHEVHAVEQQHAVDVAVRDGAVARDDGILAAGDTHVGSMVPFRRQR